MLTDDQFKWLQKSTERIHKLMCETPPGGRQFAASVEHILQREQQWNAWKNDGCPAFTETKSKEEKNGGGSSGGAAGSSRKQKRRLGDQIRDATGAKKFLLGNKNLTTLWNVCPDNLEACSAAERDFLPSMEDYFKEAIEQLNPNEQVEDQYKYAHYLP